MENNFDDMIDSLKKEISDNLTKRISFAPIYPAKQNHFDFKKKSEKKKFLYSILGIILSFLLFIISFCIYKSNNKVLLEYSIKNDLKVDVILDDNDFSHTNSYVSSLVDNILVEFNNNLLIDSKYNSDKSLVAKVEIVDLNDVNNIVFSYEDDLLNTKGVINGNKEDKITRNIDYKKYNSISNKYRNKIKFSTSSRLRIIYKNKINNNLGIDEKIVDEIIIPLSTDTIEIDKNYTPVIENKVYDKKENNTLLYCVISFGFILFVISISSLIIILKRNRNNLTVLEKKYRKIMNNYNNIIEVEDDYFDKNLTTINVKYFVDLIDAQQELHIPILCYTDKITLRTWFYIVTDKYIYKYELTKNDELI